MIMRIAIIGGSGFIGSYTCKELIRCGYNDITIIDIISPHRDNIKNLNWKYIQCDIRDRDQIQSVIKTQKFDIIYHFAGLIRAEECRLTPALAYETNIQGLVNVLEACIDTDIKRFIFSSTTHIYNCDSFLVSEKTHINNNMHLYPGSKFCAETIIKGFNMLHNIPYTILRYGVAYGPYGHRDNVFLTFIQNVIDGEDLKIYSNGGIYRDFLFVEDHARGNIKAINPQSKNEIINLSNETINIQHLAKLILKELGSTQKCNVVEFARPGDHLGEKSFDCSKAEQLLGWKPTVSIETGIKRCYEWLKQ